MSNEMIALPLQCTLVLRQQDDVVTQYNKHHLRPCRSKYIIIGTLLVLLAILLHFIHAQYHTQQEQLKIDAIIKDHL